MKSLLASLILWLGLTLGLVPGVTFGTSFGLADVTDGHQPAVGDSIVDDVDPVLIIENPDPIPQCGEERKDRS